MSDLESGSVIGTNERACKRVGAFESESEIGLAWLTVPKRKYVDQVPLHTQVLRT